MTLSTGEPAPPFELHDQHGNTVGLQSLLSKGPLVLYFYPADFTPVCTKQACMVRDEHSELVRAGVNVAAVSTGSVASHKRFSSAFSLPFPVLSDRSGAVAKAYGAKGLLGTKRVTLLIDPDGTVRETATGAISLGAHRRLIDEAKRSDRSLPGPAPDHTG